MGEIQGTRRPEIPEAVQEAMEHVLDYLWDDELLHYEAGKESDHIFTHMLVVQKWLDPEFIYDPEAND